MTDIKARSVISSIISLLTTVAAIVIALLPAVLAPAG
jgi:hypothetical protein